MKALALKLSLLLVVLSLAVPAFASVDNLDGANVTVNYLYPEIGDIYQVLGTGDVNSGGFTVNSFGQHDFTVYPDEFTLTNVAGTDITFTPADFNGYGIVVNMGGSPITGVFLEFSNIDGFDISRVTFDDHNVWVNLEGLVTHPGLALEVGLEFGEGTVPEPGTWLLLGSGVVTLIGFARRRLRG